MLYYDNFSCSFFTIKNIIHTLLKTKLVRTYVLYVRIKDSQVLYSLHLFQKRGVDVLPEKKKKKKKKNDRKKNEWNKTSGRVSALS